MPPALCPQECDSTISCPCIGGSVSTNPAPRSLRGLNEDMCKAPARCPAYSGAFAQAVQPSRDASPSVVQQPRQADRRGLSWGLPVQGGRHADTDGTGWALGLGRGAELALGRSGEQSKQHELGEVAAGWGGGQGVLAEVHGGGQGALGTEHPEDGHAGLSHGARAAGTRGLQPGAALWGGRGPGGLQLGPLGTSTGRGPGPTLLQGGVHCTPSSRARAGSPGSPQPTNPGGSPPLHPWTWSSSGGKH